jgi:hypothetical protein
VSPETAAAQKLAEETYQKAQKLSPEELGTQEDLDKLISSTRLGIAGIEGQGRGIPLELLRGQQAKLEQQAVLLSEPLERKLARMQAARTSSLEASRFAVERADTAVERERTAAGTARTEAESTRRFGVEQAGAAESRATTAKSVAETQRMNDLNYRLSEKGFEENKRQFGLNYAQGARRIAIDEAKAALDAAPAGKATQKLETLSLARELRKADAVGKGSAVGASVAKFVPFGQSLGLQGNRSAFENRVNTLKSNLTLDNLKLLKGTMSDKDLMFLNSVGSSLTTDMQEKEFDKELDKIITKLETATGTEPGGSSSSANDAYLKSLGL